MKQEHQHVEKKPKVFKFAFNRQTKDEDILALNKRRGIAIAIQHAAYVNRPLPMQFISTANITSIHQYLLYERDLKYAIQNHHCITFLALMTKKN